MNYFHLRLGIFLSITYEVLWGRLLSPEAKFQAVDSLAEVLSPG